MTLNNSDIPAPAPQRIRAAQRLDRIQADLVPVARMWTVDEVGVAMAHQLNEPLTALLLYLHEIKEEAEHSAGTAAVRNSMREMVEMALLETERVCEIMERMGHTFEVPVDIETAVARGREAIDAWTRSGNPNGSGYASSASPRFGHRLTTREREVLALIVEGATNKEGAYRLGISKRTFEVHRANIMDKLEARNAAHLVRIALSEFR